MAPSVTPATSDGEISSEQALKWLKTNDFRDIPPYFLTHWKTNKKFFLSNHSLLAYEETNKHLIVAGESLKSTLSNKNTIYNDFLKFASEKSKKVCGYYVSQNWESSKFSKLALGTSFRIDLKSYNLKSSAAKEVRRSLRKGERNKYKIVMSPELDPNKVKSLLKKWKVKKLPLNLKFFLSRPQYKHPVDEYETWFAIEKDGEYLAFCSGLPYLNSEKEGLYIDHLIYNPFKESFALSYLISALIHDLKKQNLTEINLGLSPFANISSKHPIEKMFHFLFHLPFFYRPQGLHFFKSKFAGNEEQEYCFFQKGSNKWMGLLGMAKVTL